MHINLITSSLRFLHSKACFYVDAFAAISSQLGVSVHLIVNPFSRFSLHTSPETGNQIIDLFHTLWKIVSFVFIEIAGEMPMEWSQA